MYMAIYNKTKGTEITEITYEGDRLHCGENDMMIRPGDSSAQLRVLNHTQLSFKLGALTVKLRAEPSHINVIVEEESTMQQAGEEGQAGITGSWPIGSEPVLQRCFPGKTPSEMLRDMAAFLEEPGNAEAVVRGLTTDGAMGELVLFYENSGE
jgi:hypothetical protein